MLVCISGVSLTVSVHSVSQREPLYRWIVILLAPRTSIVLLAMTEKSTYKLPSFPANSSAEYRESLLLALDSAAMAVPDKIKESTRNSAILRIIFFEIAVHLLT